MLGREVIITFDSENQQIMGDWRTGMLESQVFLIKKLARTYLQTDSLILRKHLERFQGYNIQGEIELSGFRARVDEQLSSRQKCWKKHFFLCWSLFWEHQRLLEMPFLSLHPSGLMIPWYLAGSPNLLPVVFPGKWDVLAHAVDFSKISQRLTNPKQVASGLGVPCIFF